MRPIRLDPKLKHLHKIAKKARANAHAPHSDCRVGAVVELVNGRTYPGCNMENSSYGGTVCAERGALQTAVCAEGRIRVKRILVVTDANPPWMPCGLCRQIMSEFAADAPGGDIPIIATNLEGAALKTSLQELYPGLFSPKELIAGQKRGRSKKRGKK